MPSRIFVDTSFVLALINEKDQYHEPAKILSRQFETSSLITTDGVLLEIGNALAKDYREEAVETIKTLRHSKTVEVRTIDSELFEKGFAVYQKYDDKKWGLVDCLSFVVMWEVGVTEVLTFDDDFRQAGFVVLNS